MYINPIVQLFGQNGGKAWSDQAGSFLLLIDVKSDYKTTLPLLVEKIKKYPEVFDPKVNKNAVRVVITGNRPDPADFIQYPEVISFDGKFNLKYDEQQLKRVALYSENLWVFTQWKGKDSIPVKDLVRLKFVIDSVHCLKSAVRFWNAPDNLIAWKTLMDLKVDYINTDHINELSDFLSTK
jgi:alkaline phosphatase